MNMLHDCSFTLSQDNDTCQASDIGQELRVEFVSSDGSGHFIRLHTGECGWSIDSPEEFSAVLIRLARSVSDLKREWESDPCAIHFPAADVSASKSRNSKGSGKATSG